jgi:hypothetical protein
MPTSSSQWDSNFLENPTRLSCKRSHPGHLTGSRPSWDDYWGWGVREESRSWGLVRLKKYLEREARVYTLLPTSGRATLLPFQGCSSQVAPRYGASGSVFHHYLPPGLTLKPIDYTVYLCDHLVRAFTGCLQLIRRLPLGPGPYYQTLSPSWKPAELARWP